VVGSPPPPLPPWPGQSSPGFDPPSAVKNDGGAEPGLVLDAAGDGVTPPLDPDPPAAIATVAQAAAAATTAATTASQTTGRLELVSLMRTSFLVSGA